MARVGLHNEWERSLRLVGESCLEEDKVDGQSSANLQISWVGDSVCRKEQMKAEACVFFVLFSLFLRLNCCHPYQI